MTEYNEIVSQDGSAAVAVSVTSLRPEHDDLAEEIVEAIENVIEEAPDS